MAQFDFSFVDWSDDDSSPFDQCDSSSSDAISTVSSSLHCSTRTTKIRFAQEDDVVDHIHINNFTQEDIEACWFRPHEFRAMRESAQQFVDMMEAQNKQSIENDTMTSRGLEMRTTQGGSKRSAHRRQAYGAVMAEQERQWNYGRDEPDRIAAAYQIISSKCLGLALLRGVQDEHDVREYVSEPTTPSSSEEPTTACTISSSTSVESTCPSKPYEIESNIRRLAVLEDLKILSGAAEFELWQTNPAAA